MRKVVLAAVAALSIFAVPAFAAPERTGTLSAASSTFGWDGGPKNGLGPGDGTIPFGYARCSQVYQCEDTLLEVKDAGTLTIEIKAGDGSEDLDLRLYKSDANGGHDDAGTPIPTDDPTLAEDITEKPDAKVTIKNIKPGWYLAQVAFYKATNGVYKGTATLTGAGAAPAPVAPPPVTTTPPPSQPNSSSSTNSNSRAKARAAYNRCVKKAKKNKNKRKRSKALKACKRKRR